MAPTPRATQSTDCRGFGIPGCSKCIHSVVQVQRRLRGEGCTKELREREPKRNRKAHEGLAPSAAAGPTAPITSAVERSFRAVSAALRTESATRAAESRSSAGTRKRALRAPLTRRGHRRFLHPEERAARGGPVSSRGLALAFLPCACMGSGAIFLMPLLLAWVLWVFVNIGLCWRSLRRALLSGNSYTEAKNSEQGA